MQYTNNTEYRQKIRDFFKMEQFPQNLDINELESETYDELLYDGLAAQQNMNIIYEKTKTNPAFCTLYEKAAAKFFSTDLQIGLSILFCYDYFSLFYACLTDFDENPAAFTKENKLYMALYAKL